MNVLSLFDGISCGMVALERSGITVENYSAYEIGAVRDSVFIPFTVNLSLFQPTAEVRTQRRAYIRLTCRTVIT